MSVDQKPNGVERQARLLAGLIAVIAGLLRLVPHPWNFTPVGALGLFGGGRLRSWRAFALPLAVMIATDILLAFIRGSEYSRYLLSPMILFVYGSFLLNVFIGRALCRTQSFWRIGTASLLASLQFFLLSNFGQWLIYSVEPGAVSNVLAGEFPRTLSGLVDCYILAIPFFGTTLVGDLAYSGVLFGAYALLVRPQLATEQVEAVTDSK
jgi:hypothetical protein